MPETGGQFLQEWINELQGLSEDEASSIRSLLTHEGWTLLTGRVWPRRMLMILFELQRQTDDHRFWQGMYEGFSLCQRTAAAAPEVGQKEFQTELQRIIRENARRKNGPFNKTVSSVWGPQAD